MINAINKEIEDFKVITITHKTTSVQRLKDYLLDDSSDSDYPKSRLTELKSSFQINELMYLNTCNRVTFFFTSKREVDDQYLKDLFLFINPVINNDLVDRHIAVTKVYSGNEALEHFFSVAASMDSLIVGEREILGQIKEAYANSKKYGLSGDSIRLAIEKAIVFAKKIHNETKISEKPVSIVSIAFRQLLEHLPSKETGILMIGAGQSNQQLANFLKKYDFHNVHVFNRTLEKAQELAEKLGGHAYELNQLSTFKAPFNVVVSCTGANDLVLTKAIFDQLNTDKNHAYTFLDLAVPRDIDPAIADHYDVNYLDIDSLEAMANHNLSFRQKEVIKAKEILDLFIVEFENTFRQRQLELALIDIPTEVKALKQKAVNEVFSKDIEQLDDEARKVLENMMDYLEKKYIGIPMKIAKKTILGLNNFKD
ncbi:MAG: glutamyl-tRNA reductase [Bacteroidetes bacterium]|nr:glutamyl-tRNA reductase [Bacteroidota bacterium]